MAKDTKKQQPAVGLPEFEPGAKYRVQLRRATRVGGMLLLPQNDNVLSGKVAASIAADIESAEKVA